MFVFEEQRAVVANPRAIGGCVNKSNVIEVGASFEKDMRDCICRMLVWNNKLDQIEACIRTMQKLNCSFILLHHSFTANPNK
jgi:hypothetical protein